MYRTTPHSTTQFTPYFLLFSHEPRTKLPGATSATHQADPELRARDSLAKLKMKQYADHRNRAKHREMFPGDYVLVKQPKQNKLSTNYNPNPLRVTDVNQSMVTAQRPDGSKMTRNSSLFRRLVNSSDDIALTEPVIPNSVDPFSDNSSMEEDDTPVPVEAPDSPGVPNSTTSDTPVPLEAPDSPSTTSPSNGVTEKYIEVQSILRDTFSVVTMADAILYLFLLLVQVHNSISAATAITCVPLGDCGRAAGETSIKCSLTPDTELVVKNDIQVSGPPNSGNNVVTYGTYNETRYGLEISANTFTLVIKKTEHRDIGEYRFRHGVAIDIDLLADFIEAMECSHTTTDAGTKIIIKNTSPQNANIRITKDTTQVDSHTLSGSDLVKNSDDLTWSGEWTWKSPASTEYKYTVTNNGNCNLQCTGSISGASLKTGPMVGLIIACVAVVLHSVWIS
ncbi:hypothetical protein ScPMuIL_002596 [Solemya velum]